MKRAFGMPRGFFSPSWMMSGGVFEVDMLWLRQTMNGSNLCSEISQIGGTGAYLLMPSSLSRIRR